MKIIERDEKLKSPGNHILKPEDYVEPRCVLCGDPYGVTPEVKPVPQQRIIQKMDEYMSRRDYEGAGRHLLYWLEEARFGSDLKGQLMICNELVGYYRKMSDRENAFIRGEEALRLLSELHMEDSISAGTTYVNLATACNAFQENQRALELFYKAKLLYESSGQTRPDLLGGLYNNMALTCAALGRFDEAGDLYEKALSVMADVTDGELEQAITYLNMANAIEYEHGLEEGDEEICTCLDKALELLDTPTLPRDGYYAFVCEKCAPTFEYYGYFLAGKELTGRAEEIYSRLSQDR
ncbi:MAG: tetratricopeptide repeat protein [Eubacterium sp.]|nr:tetratricopeptide repeat protein [Eubacterium sp.]